MCKTNIVPSIALLVILFVYFLSFEHLCLPFTLAVASASIVVEGNVCCSYVLSACEAYIKMHASIIWMTFFIFSKYETLEAASVNKLIVRCVRYTITV